MNINKTSFFIIIVLVSIYQITFAIDKKAHLKKLSSELHSLQIKQSSEKNKRKAAISSLRKADLSINHIHLSLNKLKQEEVGKKASADKLSKEINTLQQAIKKQQDKLTTQLILNYQLGKNIELKLLLNQNDAALTDRLLTYLSFLNKARLDTMRQLDLNVKTLTIKKSTLDDTLRTVKDITDKQKSQFTLLEKEKRKQLALIKALNAHLHKRNNRIQAIIRDKAKLQALISKLKARSLSLNRLRFSHMKHKLPWPVEHAKVINHFNQESNGITYHGIVLKALEGTPIRAVYSGQIVYSGWLNGYGLILLINHGLGYMSLYANNQAIYGEMGQFVTQGDIIARLGHSGGQLEDGLYFELRHNGKPVSPLSWLQKTKKI